MKTRKIPLMLLWMVAAAAMPAIADAAGTSGSAYGPPSSSPMPQLRKPQPPPPPPPRQRPPLPQMHAPMPVSKAFGMPGVVGIVNDKWEETDYLGYLSNKIGIDIEVLKTSQVVGVPDNAALQRIAEAALTKENIIPNAEVVEGPILPLLHFLIFIYPIDTNNYVIFGNVRLFEKIHVERKDFMPKGYWQGITWENQDVAVSNSEKLGENVTELVSKLADIFAKRYRQYNALNPPQP